MVCKLGRVYTLEKLNPRSLGKQVVEKWSQASVIKQATVPCSNPGGKIRVNEPGFVKIGAFTHA